METIRKGLFDDKLMGMNTYQMLSLILTRSRLFDNH